MNGTHFGTSAWTSSYTAQGNTLPTGGTFSTTEAGVIVAYSASTWWRGGSWGVTGTSNEGLNLFRSYLDDGDNVSAAAPASLGIQTNSDGIGAVFQVSGLSAWLAGNSATAYNITVLFANADTGRNMREYTVRDGDLQGTILATSVFIPAQGDGGWDGVTDHTPDSTTNSRGIIEFTNLSADTITISGLVRQDGTTSRGSIAGFVITSIPEPSTALLGAFGVLAFLSRRR